MKIYSLSLSVSSPKPPSYSLAATALWHTSRVKYRRESTTLNSDVTLVTAAATSSSASNIQEVEQISREECGVDSTRRREQQNLIKISSGNHGQ